MSSKSTQMKTASSNPALRQVLLLRQIQDLPVHCLLALIFYMYYMCIRTNQLFNNFLSFLSLPSKMGNEDHYIIQ
jgi:hypothetical protein